MVQALGFIHGQPKGGGGGAGGHIIEDEGAPLPAEPDLNFIGDIVEAADDVGNTATTVTISTIMIWALGD